MFRKQRQLIPTDTQKMILSLINTMTNNSCERAKLNKTFVELYQQFEPLIEHLKKYPEKIPTLIDVFSAKLQSLTPSINKHAKLIQSGVALNLFNSVAADNMRVIQGAAPGSTLCSGISQCMQSYIVNSTNAVQASLNVFLDAANRANLGAVWAFNNCINTNKLGNELINILQQNSSSLFPITSICAADAKTVIGSGEDASSIVIHSQVSALTQDECLAYKNVLNAENQRCMASDTVIGLNWAVAGIFIGAFILCCIPIAITFYRFNR